MLTYWNNAYFKYGIVILLMYFAGRLGSTIAIGFSALLALTLFNWRNNVLILGLLIVTYVFSDSRHAFLSWSQSYKVFLLLGVCFFVLNQQRNYYFHKYWRYFLVFFLFAFYCILDSLQKVISLQKTVSYLLLLVFVPTIVYKALQDEKKFLLQMLLYIGLSILIIGLVFRLTMPHLAIFTESGRFSGMLGNPNGLGIFCICYSIMAFYIIYHHPQIISRIELYILIGTILISVLMAGSRGAIFSILLLIIGVVLMRHNVRMGIIGMLSLFIGYKYVMANFIEVVHYLKLEDYFRLDTFEAGSGRIVAADFIKAKIQDSYYIGKGFGYTEYVFHQAADFFTSKGHQGNAHNSYLTIWADIGLLGLIAFCWAWLKWFYEVSKKQPLVWAALFAIVLTSSVESWLAASMNPFTIQLVIVLTLLSSDEFYEPLPSV